MESNSFKATYLQGHMSVIPIGSSVKCLKFVMECLHMHNRVLEKTIIEKSVSSSFRAIFLQPGAKTAYKTTTSVSWHHGI
jgi:hypothetical protein